MCFAVTRCMPFLMALYNWIYIRSFETAYWITNGHIFVCHVFHDVLQCTKLYALNFTICDPYWCNGLYALPNSITSQSFICFICLHNHAWNYLWTFVCLSSMPWGVAVYQVVCTSCDPYWCNRLYALPNSIIQWDIHSVSKETYIAWVIFDHGNLKQVTKNPI